MILFLRDWQKYPSAIVHTSTTNKSFLRMAEVYKKMGIKNYYFHLALLNPMLEHVDPHSPHLTPEEMAMVGYECKYNPWYFFREVVRIPPQASRTPIPFKANRGNIALIWSFFNHIDILNIQNRQSGKSVSTDCIITLLKNIAAENTTIVMITKDDTLRGKNIERLKKMEEYLPRYLNLVTKADADNKKELTVKALGNHYITGVSQNNEISANNMGRGLTSPIVHIDEPPFINFIDVVIPALLASTTAVREEARRNGTFYGNIFTTTAGKKDTRSGEYMYDMMVGGMVWSEPKLFDLNNEEEAHLIVRKNSPGFKSIINATFSHRQLGFTDEWLAKVMQEAGSQGEDADRDFFNRWTSGSLSSPLSTELNTLIRESERDPSYVEISKEGYTLDWYIPKHEIEDYMRNNKVAMGMDTSEAIGKDSITMVLTDVNTLKVIAASAINETNLIRYATYVGNMLIRFENITLIPERKSTGIMLVDSLLLLLPAHGIDPFKRIYSKIVDNCEEMETEYKMINLEMHRRPTNVTEKYKRYLGFNTSGAGQYSRNMLYSDVLQTAARRGGAKVHDRRLAGEITGLTSRNGRIDHGKNGHDDMVIAWLLTVWFLVVSRNHKHYGITSVLRDAQEYNVKKAAMSDMERYLEEEQTNLKQQIHQLIERLKETNDDLISMKLEQRIRLLDSQVTDEYISDSSIDTLIKDAKGLKRKNRRTDGKDFRSIRDRNHGYY